MVSRCWQFGERPRRGYCHEFQPELRAMLSLPSGTAADGSAPAGAADLASLRAEVVALMLAAHQGSVRRIQYQKVRDRETLVELKFPRPGNLKGWHFRLYTGAPDSTDQDHLVWSAAGRKVDSLYDSGWKQTQTDAINNAHVRLNRWVAARFADSV